MTTTSTHEKHDATGFPTDGVSVIVTTYNHADYLGAALDSVLAQTVPAAEVIVVDDGSTDDPESVMAGRPGVRLIRQPNRGPSAARNAGLRAARFPLVLFLDADDLLTPVAIAAGLACFARDPGVAFVYGAHRRVDADLVPLGERRYKAVRGDAFTSLLYGNLIGMHATVLYRRELLLAAGGFDEDLRSAEDYDLYLRLARDHRIGTHPVETAWYRWHGANTSADPRAMLRETLKIHRVHRPGKSEEAARRTAWQAGRRAWTAHYVKEVVAGERATGRSRLRTMTSVASLSSSAAARLALRAAARRAPTWRPVDRPPVVGKVNLGSLDRTRPISMDFGYDRGVPIDRYYIERFLDRSAEDIRGRVLEVGDATYSRRFGAERITTQDVLHVEGGNPEATVVGDMSVPGVLPAETFDCIVLTQTLHLVYDPRAAVEQLHRSLKPGGVLLMTVPGISQLDRGAWNSRWYWSMTPAAVERLLGDVFGAEAVSVEGHGNVYAATTFLQGMALGEVSTRMLDEYD